jgi:hypothetical protein
LAAGSYIDSELSIDKITKTIHMPKLAFWYEKDFGIDSLHTLQKLLSFLSDSSRLSFVNTFLELFPGVDVRDCQTLPEGCEIKYNDYSWDSNDRNQ